MKGALLRCGRRIAVTISALVAAVVLAPVAPATDAQAAQRTIEYSTGALGFTPSKEKAERFRAVVKATLNDPRGWSLNRSVAFRRGGRGQFRVSLATPSAIDRYPGCSALWSCRVGFNVMINDMRWERATATYPGQPLLHAYRQLMINHEVGHALGFGHASCPRSGALAPVMQQQSKGLNGCEANPWPLSSERAVLARRLGVRVGRPQARLTLGVGAGGIYLGDHWSSVLARLGEPQERSGPPSRRIYRYSYYRLTLKFLNERVTAITTRSEHDRTARGRGVGTSHEELRSVGCVDTAPDRCVFGRSSEVGDTPTTFFFRGGRVSSVRVERLTED